MTGFFVISINDYKSLYLNSLKLNKQSLNFSNMRNFIFILCLLFTSLSLSAQSSDIPFKNLKDEDAPIYSDCKWYAAGVRNCFDLKINDHVKEKLNTDLLLELGASTGRKRIYSQIRITKQGSIEIIGIRAPYPRFAKEVDRVLRLFPNVSPGKQNGKPVSVSYMCEIVIDVTKNSAEVVDYWDLN